MVYLVQGDEFEVKGELLRRLADVLAESEELTLADAIYRLRSSHGILRFESREEAERVAARFTELAFANFLLDELLEMPRPKLLGVGAAPPDEKVGMVALARLETEAQTTAVEDGESERPGYLDLPIRLFGAGDTTVTERTTRYVLDMMTREQHWRLRSEMLPRVVDVFLELDVSEAYLSDGVRSLSRSDRSIPTFGDKRAHGKYLTWLFHLRYA